MIDSWVALVILLSLLGFLKFAFNVTMPAWAIKNQITWCILLYFVWVPAEATFLSLFSTTPAKWLFGISVKHPSGDFLSYSKALERSALVCIKGAGLGIPLITVFTGIFAYRRLTKTGTTLWDTNVNSVVLHKEWSVFRGLACAATVFAIVALILSGSLNLPIELSAAPNFNVPTGQRDDSKAAYTGYIKLHANGLIQLEVPSNWKNDDAVTLTNENNLINAKLLSKTGQIVAGVVVWVEQTKPPYSQEEFQQAARYPANSGGGLPCASSAKCSW